jgi:hypothetical protein
LRVALDTAADVDHSYFNEGERALHPVMIVIMSPVESIAARRNERRRDGAIK